MRLEEMQSLKSINNWHERYNIARQKEPLPYDIIEEGLLDKDYTVRAAFLRRTDFKIKPAQISAALKDSSPIVKIALIRRADVSFSEEEALALSNDVWPIVREIFKEKQSKASTLKEKVEESPWWMLESFAYST